MELASRGYQGLDEQTMRSALAYLCGLARIEAKIDLAAELFVALAEASGAPRVGPEPFPYGVQPYLSPLGRFLAEREIPGSVPQCPSYAAAPCWLPVGHYGVHRSTEGRSWANLAIIETAGF